MNSDPEPSNDNTPQADKKQEKEPKKPRVGGGRHGFDDYPNAPINNIGSGYCAGDKCPLCNSGRLYKGESRKLLEFTGSSPIEATKHEKEVMRCNKCSHEFMSNAQVHKWNNTARSSIVLQRVFGMPFYRLSKLQALCQTPVSEATMWEQFSGLWNDAGLYIYNGLLSLSAESETLYSDDTRVRILSEHQKNKALPKNEKRACHTTVCLSMFERHHIALYISANRHCGENLGLILSKRKNREKAIKLMIDASSCNTSFIDENFKKILRIIVAKCLTHGRRKFTDLEDFYPEECGYFLGKIALIYFNEKKCKSENYSAAKRLAYHQRYSKKHIYQIYSKIEHLFKNKQVEPNSSLGRAMKYWLNHKDGLCKFLEVDGIELDNNSSERALKTIILQRKNSLFYKNVDTAEVSSGLSSIVKTCELNKVNAFKYLNWIQDNYKEVREDPGKFMPWHYGSGPPVFA